MTRIIGQPLSRVEGPLKATGKARYSGEFPAEKMAYAAAVTSPIAAGKIKSINTKRAEKSTGVLAVITHENRPALKAVDGEDFGSAGMEGHLPLQSEVIFHAGQYVAIVVAETLEAAQQAVRLVEVTYSAQKPLLDLEDKRAEKYKSESMQRSRGNADAAIASAPFKIDEIYTTPFHNHNPIEPHAATAVFEGSKLTLYVASQFPAGVRKSIARLFGLDPSNIRVVSRFVGGAFGGKGNMWSFAPLAVIAAKVTNRPVKFVLPRKQMFSNVGGRACTKQRVVLASEKDGTLKAIMHSGKSNTAIDKDFTEPFSVSTPMLYACDNLFVEQEVVRLNRNLPTYMRAPGEAPGLFALESAMDELAHKLGMDPIELRMKNYAQKDPDSGKPFSSKTLDKCYKLGAEKIGWDKRAAQPGKRLEGNQLVGLGMASATRGAKHFNGSASARLNEDGTFLFKSSTPEQGTGTPTVMAQIAADCLGVQADAVVFDWGDTDFATAPIAAGSATITTIGNAVHGAAEKLQSMLKEKLAQDPNSPFKGVDAAKIVCSEGKLSCEAVKGKALTYKETLELLHINSLETIYSTSFNDREVPYALHGFGAHFAEVKIDPDLCEIRVSRFVSAVTCGRVMNQMTCMSQVRSGIIWGISMALFEQAHVDARSGRVMNDNLAEYLIPVNADVPDIEAYIIEEDDQHMGALGAKGVGEIGITGAAAAVANAIFNATGKRIRDLPITLDKLLL